MKIFYTVTITGNQHESHERADDATPMCCCDEMYNAWSEVIAFDPERQVVDLQFYHPSSGDTELWGGVGLRHCPWCSQPIEVECTATKDERTTACAAELKTPSPWGDKERKTYCSNRPLADSPYCGRHRHSEEGAAGSLGREFQLKRTCECDPATLVCFVLWPEPGVRCECGAVWTLADELEDDTSYWQHLDEAGNRYELGKD